MPVEDLGTKWLNLHEKLIFLPQKWHFNRGSSLADSDFGNQIMLNFAIFVDFFHEKCHVKKAQF